MVQVKGFGGNVIVVAMSGRLQFIVAQKGADVESVLIRGKSSGMKTSLLVVVPELLTTNRYEQKSHATKESRVICE